MEHEEGAQCDNWIAYRDYDGTWEAMECRETAIVQFIFTDPRDGETYTAGMCSVCISKETSRIMSDDNFVGVLC